MTSSVAMLAPGLPAVKAINNLYVLVMLEVKC